jgi:hypothetical protein
MEINLKEIRISLDSETKTYVDMYYSKEEKRMMVFLSTRTARGANTVPPDSIRLMADPVPPDDYIDVAIYEEPINQERTI